MGYIYRWFICLNCGEVQRVRQRRKPKPCRKCGGKAHKARPRWSICLRIAGKQTERAIGTEIQATKTLRTWEGQIAEGKFHLFRKDRQLFRDFVLEEWWPTYAEVQLAESTRKDYWNRLHKRVLPRFGHLYLDQIERKDIQGWLAKIKSEGKAPATVNKFLSILQSIFKQAVLWQEIEYNPTQNIPRQPVDNKQFRYLSKEEYDRLIKTAGNDQLRAAIALAVLTGLRRSALFGLRWSYIDFKLRKIVIPTSLSKSKKNVTLPIIEPVLEVLNSLPRSLHSDYVLVKPRTGTRYRDMRAAFERAMRIAGIDDFSWHGFRHTFASWHIMAGTDPKVLQELMGLSSLQMVERYAHLSEEYVRRQADNISLAFEKSDEKREKKKG